MAIEDLITADLDWRENELVNLKFITLSTEIDTPQRGVMLRAMWALLYAHYEGFFKYAWDCVLAKLDAMNLDRSSLLEPLEILSMETLIKETRKGLPTKDVLDFCKRFNDMYQLPAKFEVRLDTESNLYPNVIDDNNAILNINLVSLDTHRVHLKSLVARRNKIAHGEAMTIRDIDHYTEYENAALDVMHEFAVKCVDYINNSEYIKQTA